MVQRTGLQKCRSALPAETPVSDSGCDINLTSYGAIYGVMAPQTAALLDEGMAPGTLRQAPSLGLAVTLSQTG